MWSIVAISLMYALGFTPDIARSNLMPRDSCTTLCIHEWTQLNQGAFRVKRHSEDIRQDIRQALQNAPPVNLSKPQERIFGYFCLKSPDKVRRQLLTALDITPACQRLRSHASTPSAYEVHTEYPLRNVK